MHGSQDMACIRFHSDFSKGHNSRKGDNSDKKKRCINYFSMRNPYMKFKTLACTVHKIWHACFEQTHACKDNLKPICPVNFFGGITTIFSFSTVTLGRWTDINQSLKTFRNLQSIKRTACIKANFCPNNFSQISNSLHNLLPGQLYNNMLKSYNVVEL